MRQFDVKNAFLHGVLDEDVLKKWPSGYEDSSSPMYIDKLDKALYGLNRHLEHGTLACHISFNPLASPPPNKIPLCSFIINKEIPSLCSFMLMIYCYQFLSQSTWCPPSWFVHGLCTQGFGQSALFFGIEVKSVSDGIVLSQGKYLLDLLKRVDTKGCKPVSTSLSISK